MNIRCPSIVCLLNEKLCVELEIPILSPEVVAGSFFARANWILRGATDMSRIDVLRGGITGCKKWPQYVKPME